MYWGPDVWSIDLGDLDGDGDLDRVNAVNRGIDYYSLNDGTGVFTDWVIPSTDDSSTTSISLGDFDGDGDLDIIRGVKNDWDTVLLNQGLLPNGKIEWSAPILLPESVSRNTMAVTVGDFNNDGFVDGAGFALWENAFGLGDGADIDLDGDSDGRDFLFWQRQFGQHGGGFAASAAVPEPATVTVAWLVALCLASATRANRPRRIAADDRR